MTKAQQKALEKAKTRNFTRKQMDFLQDESHYAWAYTFAASYFTYVNKNYSNNITLLDNSVDMLDKFCTECPNDHIAKEYAWAYLRSPECTIYIFSCIYKERIILEYFLGFIKADTKQSDLLHILEQIEAKTPEDDFDDVGWHEVCSSDDEQFSTRDIIAIYAYIYRYCFFEDSIPMERIDTFLSELTPATLLSLYKDWKSCSSVAFWIANFIKNNVPVEEAIAYHWDINAYNAMQGRKNREKLGIFTTAYPEEKWKDGPPIYHMPNESTLLELQKYRIDMIVSCVAYSLRVKWLDYGVMFTFRTYKSVAIASDKIYPKEESKSLMILLTYDGALLRESPRIKKFIPLSVKDLAKYYSSDNILLDRFLNTLEQYYLDCGKPFIKDVMPYLKGKDFFLPIALKDLMEYTSFHHAFNEKYPVGKNWNTNDINWLYMLHSISPYISDLDLRRLKNMSQQSYEKILTQSKITMYQRFSSPKRYGSPQATLLETILQSRFPEEEANTHMISDYINMCFRTKEKVRLGFYSIRKLKEEHDRISEKYTAFRTKPVKVPKKSKFNALSAELGTDFEWIKTKQRLVHEAQTMHHCVWNYADKITADKCAIYHFIFAGDEKPYTVEIIQHGTEFAVRQVFGVHDSYNEDAKTYVCNLVSAVNEVLTNAA